MAKNGHFRPILGYFRGLKWLQPVYILICISSYKENKSKIYTYRKKFLKQKKMCNVCMKCMCRLKEVQYVDFYQIRTDYNARKNTVTVSPEFLMTRSTDYMARGGAFYAIWDEERNIWSTDEYDVFRIVDRDLRAHASKLNHEHWETPPVIVVDTLLKSGTTAWDNYSSFRRNIPNNDHQLDCRVTFQNDEIVKGDYVSKRLPYSLSNGDCPAYEEILSTLYEPDERAKIEWAIGAIFEGDGRWIQKFIVLYGEMGSGKSTVLNIIQMLFEGYYTMFEAKSLVGSNNTFSTETFRTNPLVAIQHDGDLSKIEDNTKLNSIVSHEEMELHEKYKSSYISRMNCFLFVGSNKPVRITDAKSGLIRRLIDVSPSGRRIPPDRYYDLIEQVKFELGAIANHCIHVYRKMGKNYYSQYTPNTMIEQTDPFYNFILDNYFEFKKEDNITLKRAWTLYKEYFEKSGLKYDMPMYKFRQELKNYYRSFKNIAYVDGRQERSYYEGFLHEKIKGMEEHESDRGREGHGVDEALYGGDPSGSDGGDGKGLHEDLPLWLGLSRSETGSIFDSIAQDYPAQYAVGNDIPGKPWDKVQTTLGELDTGRVHYVKVPENHIVIDFDLKDENGNKSLELNLQAAAKWPATYAELSKGGNGLHLHYIYDGDSSRLSRVYEPEIEVKVFTGKSSLRRKLSLCNDFEIAHISSGLPLKGDKTMINFDAVLSEKKIRELILRNLNKEIHGYTAPSIDFIHHILEEQYNKGAKYDVTDLRPRIMAFANNSTNQSAKCLEMVVDMKFKSEEASDPAPYSEENDELVFFDVEVFPNLFLVCYKVRGKGHNVIPLINPKPSQLEDLIKMRLVGFNCRRYDNHMVYAAYLGYNNLQLYNLSKRLIGNSKNACFGEAYNLSYTDVYDFASAANKKSLKKFEIELGIHHQELGLPWDQPVPEELWPKVAEYCGNDVIATEATFDHLAGDWAARQILAELSGLTVNDTTNKHSARIIFGRNRKPQSSFHYRNLAEPVKSIDDNTREYLEKNTPLPLKFTPYDGGEESILPYFPGYKFENGVSTYRGDVASEGGYVYSEPGIHYRVALLDVASMHPSSAENECLFGSEYTQNLTDIKQSRVGFKHEDVDSVAGMLGGALVQFAEMAKEGVFSFKDISNALKTVINSVYGMTSAKFDNEFRDPRNIDNIVAKRGALFMIDLKHAVQEQGFTVAHIKTDSIKIPNATPAIIEFVMEFGKKYGYAFEHEATYEKMCLVDKANYVAKYASVESCEKMYGYCPGDNKKKAGEWTVTGDNFAHPYIFKTLFTHEKIEFKDFQEVKSVQKGDIYIDMNEDLPDVSMYEKELKSKKTTPERAEELKPLIAEGHFYQFVGRVGAFCAIKPGRGGGVLYRFADDKYYAVGGTKGYRWLEYELVESAGKQKDIDMTYYRSLVDDAVTQLAEYGDVQSFLADDAPQIPTRVLPWCDELDCQSCIEFDECQSTLPF